MEQKNGSSSDCSMRLRLRSRRPARRKAGSVRFCLRSRRSAGRKAGSMRLRLWSRRSTGGKAGSMRFRLRSRRQIRREIYRKPFQPVPDYPVQAALKGRRAVQYMQHRASKELCPKPCQPGSMIFESEAIHDETIFFFSVAYYR